MRRVLLVEDSRTQLLHSQAILEGYGLEVIAASDGEQALIKARNHHPDLIMLDIEMPGMDGLSVCRALSRDPLTQDIPIFILSSHDRRSARLRALMRGARDYLIKPLAAENLREKVEKNLNLSLNG